MPHETTRHYDQEVELFRRFLDPYMKYTCALFASDEEELEVASRRMLDETIAAGNLPPGARILEIGTGWGSLLKRLGEVGSGFRYTGVNPSSVQQAYIRAEVRADAHVDLRVAPFEDVMDALEGEYDAIFMIGCLCHMKEKERVLARVAQLLAPAGTVVFEDTFFLSEELYRRHHDRPETRFVQNDVFGFAHVHSLGRHLDTARGAGLRVMTTRDVSDHYERTIDRWKERLGALDPAQFELAPKFVQYLEIFQRGWGHTITEHLMTMKKLPPRPARAERVREAAPSV